MKSYVSVLTFSFMMLAAVCSVSAQDGPSDADLAKANNPLAEMTALNFQNYYVPTFYGADELRTNTFWIRYAQPVGRVLIRASLPVSTVSASSSLVESGLGDINVFAAYLAVSEATKTFGIGPLVVAPTASDDILGSGRWQAGAAAVAFLAPAPQFQVGGLLTWQHSVGSDDDGDTSHLAVLQPFGFWQLGGGTYLRSAPIWVFNIEQESYHVPFGFGIGRVIPMGNTVFNIFIEPQFTILHHGAAQPALQIFTALNLQFK